MKASDGTPQPVTSSTSEEIGTAGGEFKSGYVSVVVPEGALSGAATFSVDTYVDKDLIPPIDEHKKQVVLSPVVRLSSSHGREFDKPIQLTMPPDVPLKTGPDSGWLLELKKSEASADGQPGQWLTALILDTTTREVVTHLSSVWYDPDSGTIQLTHADAFLAWLGKSEGSRSSRKIRYALFGKEVQSRKWCIAAHVIHGSPSVYYGIAECLRAKSYIELSIPTPDCIGVHGEVAFNVKCVDPWQIRQGKPEARIDTRRIWHSEVDAACYYEFTLEDTSSSSETLECTVQASFLDHGEKTPAGEPIELVVCRRLDAPDQHTANTSRGLVHEESFFGKLFNKCCFPSHSYVPEGTREKRPFPAHLNRGGQSVS